VASVRDAVAAGLGKLQGALQMILDLRQGLTRELLELQVVAARDMRSERRRSSFLILDLAAHIVAVERGAVVRLERGNHRVISAVRQRVRESHFPVAGLQSARQPLEYDQVGAITKGDAPSVRRSAY
jgi:hypothetical protein